MPRGKKRTASQRKSSSNAASAQRRCSARDSSVSPTSTVQTSGVGKNGSGGTVEHSESVAITNEARGRSNETNSSSNSVPQDNPAQQHSSPSATVTSSTGRSGSLAANGNLPTVVGDQSSSIPLTRDDIPTIVKAVMSCLPNANRQLAQSNPEGNNSVQSVNDSISPSG